MTYTEDDLIKVEDALNTVVAFYRGITGEHDRTEINTGGMVAFQEVMLKNRMMYLAKLVIKSRAKENRKYPQRKLDALGEAMGDTYRQDVDSYNNLLEAFQRIEDRYLPL